jgi:NAD(P)-dependent dehydrogenase (short-subunit alcohol dehydrogenase family)
VTEVMFITGASRRLGAEIARTFAARAFHVIVHARTANPDAVALTREILGSGRTVSLVTGDLADEGAFARIVDAVYRESDHVDVLVNNASAFEYDFPGRGELAHLRRSLDIHAVVPFCLIETFARKASAQRRLDVFNILDQKLEHVNPDYYSYTVGKAALHAITKCWQAADTKAVRVFGILPGTLYPSGPQTEEEFAAASRSNLLAHAPTPQDVCDAIRFLHENSGLPGQDLAVDAGERLTQRRRDPAYDASFTSRG